MQKTKPCWSVQTKNVTKAESIQMGGENISLNPHFKKNLRVFLDNTLSMEQHISHLCQTSCLCVRQIASIGRHLTEKTLSSWCVHLCCQG